MCEHTIAKAEYEKPDTYQPNHQGWAEPVLVSILFMVRLLSIFGFDLNFQEFLGFDFIFRGKCPALTYSVEPLKLTPNRPKALLYYKLPSL